MCISHLLTDFFLLKENIQAIYRQLLRIKPSTVKGVYVLSANVTSTMGPGVKVDSSTIA